MDVCHAQLSDSTEYLLECLEDEYLYDELIALVRRKDRGLVQDSDGSAWDVADAGEDPFENVCRAEMAEQMRKVLCGLSTREERILRMHFGIGWKGDCTLEEIGRGFMVTSTRVQQIEAKALRKLRHPSRSKALRCYLESAKVESPPRRPSHEEERAFYTAAGIAAFRQARLAERMREYEAKQLEKKLAAEKVRLEKERIRQCWDESRARAEQLEIQRVENEQYSWKAQRVSSRDRDPNYVTDPLQRDWVLPPVTNCQTQNLARRHEEGRTYEFDRAINSQRFLQWRASPYKKLRAHRSATTPFLESLGLSANMELARCWFDEKDGWRMHFRTKSGAPFEASLSEVSGWPCRWDVSDFRYVERYTGQVYVQENWDQIWDVLYAWESLVRCARPGAYIDVRALCEARVAFHGYGNVRRMVEAAFEDARKEG